VVEGTILRLGSASLEAICRDSVWNSLFLSSLCAQKFLSFGFHAEVGQSGVWPCVGPYHDNGVDIGNTRNHKPKLGLASLYKCVVLRMIGCDKLSRY
jgi:hypothetical protein